MTGIYEKNGTAANAGNPFQIHSSKYKGSRRTTEEILTYSMVQDII
jgi:hypothetical protein